MASPFKEYEMTIEFKMTFEDLGNGYWKGVLWDRRDNIISMVEGECTVEPDEGFFAHLTQCAFIGKMLPIEDDAPELRIVRDGNWG